MNVQAPTVPDWLGRRKLSKAQKLALIHPDAVWTYADLWDKATGLAALMQTMDNEPSAMVGVLVQNGLTFSLCIHACIQGQYCSVPFNARLTAAEIAYQIDDAKLSLLLIDEGYAELAGDAVELSEAKPRLVEVHHNQSFANGVQSNLIHMDRPLCVIYTSGTTGRPKGTLLTYGNFLWSAMASALQLGLQQDDVWLIPMPLYHVGGLSVLMRSVIYGTTVALADRFDEKEVLSRMVDERVTLLSVVPTMLRRLVQSGQGMPIPASLRTILLGGSAPDRGLLEQCGQLGWPIALSYGLTEATSQVCTLPVEDSLRKMGSSGIPLLPTQLKIVDEDLQSLPFGQAGDIAVRGPMVSPGYLHHESSRSGDGWFRTGDIGYLDEDGYLFVLDRRSDLIVSGGENIYPAEVESVLMSHDEVAEAGVVPEGDDTWGQVPVAFIRLLEGSRVTESELSAFCAGRLARYKVPKRYVFVDQLPRNASGKLLRRTLRTWL